MKFRIRVSDKGIEIVGDAQRPEELEKILRELSPDAIEQSGVSRVRRCLST